MSSVQGCGTRVFDYCTEIPLVDVARRAQPIWMDPLPLPLPDDPLILPPERPPNSRPCSGRVSGLRGQLLSRRESEPLSLLHSSSSHLPTCLDDHTPRLKTAVSTVDTANISDQFLKPTCFFIIQVLSKGRRPLPLLSTGSDTCLLLPSVDSSRDGEGERAKVAHCLVPRSPCACCILPMLNPDLHSVGHFPSFLPASLCSPSPHPPRLPHRAGQLCRATSSHSLGAVSCLHLTI